MQSFGTIGTTLKRTLALPTSSFTEKTGYVGQISPSFMLVCF